jgi:hemolysin activation/secretion protein
VYASRSTIDTGLMTLLDKNLYNTNGNSLTRQDVQQDLTITSDAGLRLSAPIAGSANFQSGLSGGVDYKTYDLTSYKTNIFTLTSLVIDTTSNPNNPTTNRNTSVDRSAVPTTVKKLDYLPLSVRWDGSEHDGSGTTSFGFGFNGNLWYSGSEANLQNVAGSSRATGRWVILNLNAERDQNIFTNWTLALRGNGQVASEPLISNEQFGIGGVNSVRGYREGEVFGDMGWWVSAEQRTPPHVVGLAYAKNPLTIRGSLFMDYGEAYLMDPQGRKGRLPLWGVGFGGVASIGTHWEARMLFSWPLISTGTTYAFDPRLNFSLTAQF